MKVGEIVEFIKNGYPQLELDREIFIYFIGCNRDKFILEEIDNKITFIAFYLTITDETLQKIKDREINVFKEDNFLKCLSEQGQNIHFGFVVGSGVKSILKHLKQTIKKAANFG